ncbi:flavodoxin family protein [Acidaminobacter sp. JC074]|uniref:flavodoxin family protein n=1 Tax=Acidaminobacter sp. JC074 TaxID=2530199 RepID=UPI001F0F1128|nr:flavodoxin family protein [Acidaminobacter sp. JC074]MCH4889601.1 flavodoxin family protein [Acidaminobacter sp. JC074]
MKTLIINGSPRKKGDSMAIVDEMLKYLDGEVKFIHTYYADISPCLDCRFCMKNSGCCIDDEMQEVYKLLSEVDNVIITSPIYFSELTGKLLSFASRLQTYYVQRVMKKDESFKLKEKNGLLILTGGGDGKPTPAIDRAGIIFRFINAKSIGTIMSLNTNNVSATHDQVALAQAREYALKLNELHK